MRTVQRFWRHPFFFPLPSKLFCSATWANWNWLSVNWMSGNACWDCDLWPTFGTCANVLNEGDVWFWCCERRSDLMRTEPEWKVPSQGTYPHNSESSILTRQTKTNSSTAAHYSTVVSLHGWVNPSGPAVFAQRSGWTAQEGLNASYFTLLHGHSHYFSDNRIKLTSCLRKHCESFAKKHHQVVHKCCHCHPSSRQQAVTGSMCCDVPVCPSGPSLGD